MNPNKLIDSFARAFRESHDYKPPLESVRSPIFGRFLAGWIFIWRITSAFQFIKAIYKTLVYVSDGNQEEIRPILAEAYVAGTLICLVGSPAFFGADTLWSIAPYLFIFSSWKAFETLSASLYYHAFRDFFEIKDRISAQRSFLLSIADLAVICMCVNYTRCLFRGSAAPDFGSPDFYVLSFSGPKELHFDLLLSVFVWSQLTITLKQGLGFLNVKRPDNAKPA
jgi:hypothetical protein